MEGCILSRGTPEEEQEVRNGNKNINRIIRVGFSVSQCLTVFISSTDNISFMFVCNKCAAWGEEILALGLV